MKRLSIGLLLLAVLSTPPCVLGGRTKRAKTDNAAMKYIDGSFALYDRMQKQIHSFAELGYKEYRSSRLLIEHLEANGFTVEKGVAGIPTAFIATYGQGYPVIGLLAEYDALPDMSQDTVAFRCPLVAGGAGHGCGHNLLGTGAVAGAVAISKWLGEGHGGTVKLFGCPAEEGGGGKAYMVREGCFAGVDAVLDWHPDVTNVVNTETGMANVQIAFRFQGVSAHASSNPENGRSALDAVEAFDYMMNLMREHVPADSRIHYVITDGGSAPNIVPAKAEVLYYLRNPRRDVVEDLKQRAICAAEGAAMGTGTTMSYEIRSGNYERLYNRTFSEIVQRNLEYVGGVEYDNRERRFAIEMLAASGIVDTALLRRPTEILPFECDYPTAKGVSSDVGNVTWVVPTASFRVASFVPAGSGHCWQQTASGGTTIGTKAVMNVAKVMFLTAYDLYTNPALLVGICAEFEQKRGADFEFKALVGNRTPPLNYRDK